jgi:hypothetical protein
VLAGLLLEDDPEESVRIYGALRRPSLLEAPAYLRAARICEDRGERQRAIQYYRWFLDLWVDSDDPLQSEVDSARQGLLRSAAPPDSTAAFT